MQNSTHSWLKITHRCRRRGLLGVTYAPREEAYDANVMGPDKGIYKIVEPCPLSDMNFHEVHFNHGSGGCEWVSYCTPIEHTLNFYDIAPLWIEDREAERELALLELRLEATRLTFCTDGN